MVGGGLLSIKLGLLHADREVGSLGDFETFLFTSIGYVYVAFESEDTFLGWHLKQKIGVVKYNHELSERWLTKDGVVGTFKIRDHEVDVVDAKVLGGAKLHRERNLPEMRRALSMEDTPKLCLVGFEISPS